MSLSLACKKIILKSSNPASLILAAANIPPKPPQSAPSVNGTANGFGTVGAHSYLSAASRASHHPISYPGTIGAIAPGYPTTPYYVTFPADSDGEGGPLPPTTPHSGRDSGRR